MLATSGLRVHLGPVVAEVKSPFGVVANGIALHYAAHEIASATDFADFHVAVDAPRGIRRWFRRQARFRFDGNLPFNPLPANQAFPLLEWGLNWCISAHCHQYLIIHAAVVERGGRALILPAPPGSGKSTLCAALVARGWRLLSDELALIDVINRALSALPRPISLKNESIDLIARFWPGAIMSPVVEKTLKGSVAHVRPPVDSVRMRAITADPAWIAFPRYAPGVPARLVRCTKGSAFMRLVECAFNYSVHDRMGFDVLGAVVDASDCFDFEYDGSLDDAVTLFDHLAAGTAGTS